ncbi:MAG TPA: dihydrofolate reductase family protein [Micromonosporaceae bacterium]
MSRLRVHNFVVTLDGYSAGDDQSTDAAFGTAQAEFLPWFGRAHVWRDEYEPAGAVPVPSADESIAAMWGAGVGADILGRKMYHPGPGSWTHNEWRGWWGEEPPYGTPVFVMTHWEKEPLTVGHSTFHFVNGSPAEVLKLAQEAAGGKDVRLGGGPTTVNAFLAAGLIDYLHVIQIPIVLGRGVRLWDGLDGLHHRYAVQSAVMPSGATHLFFTKNE